MNTLLNEHDEDVADHHSHGGRRDREITLGTSMVLGIFFCLAAVCAVFFGFGYSIGRKSVATVMAGEQTGALTFNSFKPAPGRAIGDPLPGTVSPVAAGSPVAPAPLPPPAVRTAPASTASVTKAEAEDARARAEAVVASASLPEAPAERPAVRPAAPAPAPLAATAQPITGGGTSLVQVAAVSHQEDADMLVSTLKRRGYAVAIHSEPQDKLMHVQIGPFASRKDAEAMRQRLQNDGFNAIVK